MPVLGAFLAHLVVHTIPSTKLATFWANFIHNAIEIFWVQLKILILMKNDEALKKNHNHFSNFWA